MSQHLGHFIKNTVEPIIKEADKVLGECIYLRLKGEDIKNWMESAIGAWFAIELVKSLTFIIVSGIFGWVVWLLLR